MRPLETLHDNLCFKILDDFLTKMINDRYSPYGHEIIQINSKQDLLSTQLSSPNEEQASDTAKQ
jgi:hypothetical protein